MAWFKKKTRQKDPENVRQTTLQDCVKENEARLDDLEKMVQKMIELGATEEQLDEIYKCIEEVKKSQKTLEENISLANKLSNQDPDAETGIQNHNSKNEVK